MEPKTLAPIWERQIMWKNRYLKLMPFVTLMLADVAAVAVTFDEKNLWASPFWSGKFVVALNLFSL